MCLCPRHTARAGWVVGNFMCPTLALHAGEGHNQFLYRMRSRCSENAFNKKQMGNNLRYSRSNSGKRKTEKDANNV